MNILILSAGTRNKVVQYFKENVGAEGKVIATDCSNLAPAVFEADAFYLVPRITAPGYLDQIIEICKKESIDGVFSLATRCRPIAPAKAKRTLGAQSPITGGMVPASPVLMPREYRL